MSLENALNIYNALKTDMKQMIAVDAKAAYVKEDFAAARVILADTIALYETKMKEADGEFSGENAEITSLKTLVNAHFTKAKEAISKIDGKLKEKQQQVAEAQQKHEAEEKARAEAADKQRQADLQRQPPVSG